MRAALARRDLQVVYRRLGAIGISQRAIAAQTGVAQNEVFEVLRRGRRVTAYDVLSRIADGLGIPRGYMGLAYDDVAEASLDLAAGTCSTEPDEREKVRALLTHAAAVTVDAAVPDVVSWWRPIESYRAPTPERVGVTDLVNLEHMTAAMRTLDAQYGGGACRDAISAQSRWAQRLLAADCPEQLRDRLHTALADLHNLAGWTSFDVGLFDAAHHHFSRALEQAQYARDASLVANVHYRIGRLCLHRGFIREALRFFQLGQLAAQDSGSELTVALLCANEAWAYAMAGDQRQANKSIGRAQDEYARADPDAAPAWVRFFGLADMLAMTGMVHAALPRAGDDPLNAAITNLEAGLRERGATETRSQTFELTALATAHLIRGNRLPGDAFGHQAVDLAEQVRSVRTIDRLAPLHEAASHAGCHDLADRIATLRNV
ncbi:transcriptional regulator [Dactylosporangium sp. NPDC051485]|uniref:transcriptional regulator n=1 Tax=Dactylosporangium sp. NPDC051485 TaxID=3154846 RepID=UPI003425D4D0